MKKKKKISTKEFDTLAESGSDEIDSYLDWEAAENLQTEYKRINVDFPKWMVAALDKRSEVMGISRQALIKTIVFNEIKNKE